ncbi:MAG TPA: alpha/beta fold hydrolase [Polyangia bacterium]|nr:alpha/beta fold hydrolase [Polyangia bacterium]
MKSRLRAYASFLLAPLVLLALHAAGDPVALARRAAPSGAGNIFTTSSGTTLWYEVRGGGPGVHRPPLIVVNGGPGFDHTYMLASDVWDRLSAQRPVVLYDQRGTGRSGALKAGEPCTLADEVADLEALRARLGVEKFDLLGHSWGGYLSMAYAIRHPERVQHLVLCDAAAPRFADTVFLLRALHPEAMERRDRLDALALLGDRAAGEESLREVMNMLFLSPKKREEFLAASGTYQFSHAVNQAIEAEIARHDLGPALSQLKIPALVLTGRYDANIAPETAWKLHKLLPGSRFVVFEQSGHLPFVEEPEGFQRAVESFLNAN